MGAAIGMNTDDLFNDEDLDYACGPRSHGSKAAAGSSSRNNVVGHVLFNDLAPFFKYFPKEIDALKQTQIDTRQDRALLNIDSLVGILWFNNVTFL